MTPDRLIILGAGLTGLTAGVYSGAPIYEAASDVGGASASDCIGQFVFDRGIHVLQTKNRVITELLDEVGVRLEWRTRSAHIYSHGRYTPYPFQVNTAGLPLRLRAACVWGYLRRERNPPPTNYAEWIHRGVGRGFGDTFLIPYSEKFWTVHPREMTFDWTGNRVPQTSMAQVLRGAVWNRRTAVGTNAVFQYPENGAGYGSIPRALAARAGKIHLDHRATCVDVDARVVHFEGREPVAFEHLLSTIPLPDLIAMIPQAPKSVREAAAKLRSNSILVVNLVIDRPDLSEMHWVHFPEKGISFFRISFPKNLSPTVGPRHASSISAEVSYSADDPPDPEAVTRRVISDLRRVGVLREDDEIVAQGTTDLRYGYCIYDRNRKSAVRAIRSWLRSVDVTTAGRYGLWAYFWSHEAILNGKNTAESLVRRLRKSGGGG